MPTVRVDLPGRGYDIRIGRGLLASLGTAVADLHPTAVMVVTDPTVSALYGEKVTQALAAAGIRHFVVVVPAGEAAKSMEWAMHLYDSASAGGLDRDGLVLALGGGVVGDLAGFVAATWLRGVRLVQIPTTIMAQVDSSVGGKVAVNHPRGKNLIGCFCHPELVLTDPELLTTLPAREAAAGLAEVIKYGVISDAWLFALLEDRIEDLTQSRERDGDLDAVVIVRCCAIKAGITARDERDTGERRNLNFGHTLGHALEAVTGYSHYRHGEAVAIGMVAAARISVGLGMLDLESAVRLERLLARAGLPIGFDAPVQAVLAGLPRDKKASGGRMRWVLPETIGRVRVTEEVPPEVVRAVLAKLPETARRV